MNQWSYESPEPKAVLPNQNYPSFPQPYSNSRDKKSSNLSFWLLVLSVLGGFLGSLIYDQVKGLLKRNNNNFRQQAYQRQTKNKSIYEQHQEFRDKSLDDLDGDELDDTE